MGARTEREPTPMKNRTTVERKSERELVVTRTFNAPARLVFEAWTKPELLKRWWAPKSTGMSLLSCEADVRVGGRYRFSFVFGNDASKPSISRSASLAHCREASRGTSRPERRRRSRECSPAPLPPRGAHHQLAGLVLGQGCPV